MLQPLARALFAALSLSSIFAARAAVAQEEETAPPPVVEDRLEVFRRTDLVTTQRVRVGRGWSTERTPIYAPVCDATPCEPDLAPGTYHLAVSAPGGEIVEAEAPVEVNGRSTLHATLHDRSDWRAAGIATMIATPALATALIVASFPRQIGESSNGALLATGGTVLVFGLIAGIAMAWQHDTALFTVEPMTVGALPGARDTRAAALAPSGLAITMRF